MSEEQNDSRGALLRPQQLASFLGVGDRQTRKLLGEIEALGFKLEPDTDGARLCPPGLAAAVKACRAQKRELSSLRLDAAMSRYLAPGAGVDEADPLALLIYVAAEVAIVREVVATAANALTVGAAATSFRPFSWSANSLPDPKLAL
jgi:hypothetical protein